MVNYKTTKKVPNQAIINTYINEQKYQTVNLIGGYIVHTRSFFFSNFKQLSEHAHKPYLYYFRIRIFQPTVR